MTRLFSERFLHALEADELALLETTRSLCRETIGPNAQAVAREDVFAADTFALLVEHRIIATAFPRRFGGSEARQRLRIRLIEELGRVCSAAASLVTGADLSCRAIVAGASDAVQDQLLPALCEGRIQAAFALTEPGAGSDVRALATRAERTREGYRVSGRKKFITRANVADWYVVVARCVDEGASASEDDPFVALLISRDAPGLTAGPAVDKLGWFGVPIAELAFDRVAVDARWRLGAEGEGFALAQDALVRARLGHASMALGRAMGAVEIAAAYCCERDVFGKALGAHQGVQWMLADAITQIEASRALVDAAAASYDRGDADAAVQASMAKMHATDLGMKVCTDALQLTGGRGYLKAFPLERFFRDAKLNQIGEGSSEVHRTVIGRDAVRRAGEASIERHPCLAPGKLTTDY
ncbi:alkylation response protein AidB-like acyl-CoA dehydrogenase [Paraburkholderia unamae]|uniref:acyl-CoA dehydrogenase family protein n=1 Tax=Paraburkholderia unamae TaxID=219649 RepID=UPI000DC33214|nr:acyl-CoA dehydrogenase family protein [Paraburkholderia unamae]RAR56240.1 alkylation response protein AidB-like acyl-CoA dehydrogenase [Paraburkholderia unamae]